MSKLTVSPLHSKLYCVKLCLYFVVVVIVTFQNLHWLTVSEATNFPLLRTSIIVYYHPCMFSVVCNSPDFTVQQLFDTVILQRVLTKDLGADWKDKFHSFDPKPFAAASIGQVHHATLHDGRRVAVKVQVNVVHCMHLLVHTHWIYLHSCLHKSTMCPMIANITASNMSIHVTS